MKKKILVITGDNLGIANEQIGYKDVAYMKFPVIINDEEYRENEEHTALYLIERFNTRKRRSHKDHRIRKRPF